MTEHITPEATPVDPAAVAVPAKKSKVRRNLILAGSAAGLVGIGSTLAANINLNSGENVEFGQGVASTTACDENGFSINPVTSYDNEYSIFRVDYVEVTGLNLTPEGTGYSDGGYDSQADAKAAHPGEYYDTNNDQWKRTCDGVVLDFKAYTDDIAFWASTNDGYSNGNTNDISSPIAWYQWNGNANWSDSANFGFAVVFDTNDDNADRLANYAVGEDFDNRSAYTDYTFWSDLDHSTAVSSTFKIDFNSNSRPNAASISKITVASMNVFPVNYNEYESNGIGHNAAN